MLSLALMRFPAVSGCAVRSGAFGLTPATVS